MSKILLEDVCLDFRLKKSIRIKDLLIPGSKRFNSMEKDGTIHALKKINLELKDGDRLAIVGHNGAGKSTILKTLAGIYPLTSGKIQVIGKISSLFEMATGFEMEASGWENIQLRGLMLGETPESIAEKMEEIAAFSELGDFLDVPVKYYSSGMFIRLAFSVSTAINPEILLLDEVIGAGDAGFVSKAIKRMKELMDTANILVFVTHSMQSAVDLCNKGIWMERGEIYMQGDVKEVTQAYIKSQKNGGEQK
ncbi:MAG: ABC transporter ATP-binding protein [Desulfitobacterium sp.]